MRDLADLASEADLAASHEVRRKGPALHRRGQRQPQGEVGGGLDHPHAAGDRCEHVLSGQRHVHPPLENGEQQRQALGVQALGRTPGHRQLGRRHQRLELDEERALTLHGWQHHAAGHSCLSIPEQQLAGVGDAGQAGLGHLEQPELTRGSEPVLRGPQQPQGVVALSLEREDGVDDVLEHTGSGEGPVLGDMADQQGGNGRRLGHLQQLRGALADLGDRPGRGSQLGVEHGLDGVDDDNVGAQVGDRPQHVGKRRVREQPQPRQQSTESLGPQTDLLGGFLSRHQQGARPRGGHRRHGLEQERGLADTRLAANQRDRAGDDAARHDPVELRQPGRPRRRRRGVHVGDRARGLRRERAGARPGRPVRRRLLHQRVPLAT